MEVRRHPRNFSWRVASYLCRSFLFSPAEQSLGLWDSNDWDGTGGAGGWRHGRLSLPLHLRGGPGLKHLESSPTSETALGDAGVSLSMSASAGHLPLLPDCSHSGRGARV